MGFSVEVAGKTDVGCVRSNNEDNFGYDSRYGIYVVCDGMGGQAAGEVASKMAVDAVLNYYRTSSQSAHFPIIGEFAEGLSERAKRLGSAVRLANQAVHEAANAHAGRAGMGSTLVAISTDDKSTFFSLANVGDSRIYLVRRGAIQQLTDDHSLVMEQVRRGLITLAEARVSKMQNIIIRALGTEPEVESDVEDMMALTGDVLILCSDGLTRHVADEKMAELVSQTADLQQACEALISAAREGGGEDNVTCLLVRFTDAAWYKQLGKKVFGGGGPAWQNSI